MKYEVFKPNVCYVMKFDDETYYVGSLSKKKEYLSLGDILRSSGNPRCKDVVKGSLSMKDYFKMTDFLEVNEFDTKEEAQGCEVQKIQEYKEKYADKCLNKQVGNMYNGKLLDGEHMIKSPMSQETKEKIRKAHLGMKYTDEARLNISRSLGGKAIFQKTPNGEIKEFFSVAEAWRKTGIPKTTIRNWLSGRCKPSDGSEWGYY